MAQAPKLTRRDVGGPLAVSTVTGSGGDYHRSLARTAAGVTAQLSQITQVKKAKAQQVAVTAATKQGSVTGLSGTGAPTFRAGQSPADLAYNAAISRGYKLRVETQARSGFDEIAAANAHDPAGLQTKLADYATGFTSGLPDDVLKAEVGLMMEGLARPYISQSRRDHEKAVLEADKGAALEQLQTRSVALQRNAYLSEMSPESDALISGEISAMKDLMVEYGPKTEFTLGGVKYAADPSRAGVMTPDAIAKYLSGAETDANVSKVQGVFSRLTDETSQIEFAAQFVADFESGKGVAGTLTPDDYEAIKVDMARTLKGHATARKSAATETRQTIRDMQSVISNGLDPGDAQLGQIRTAALASGDPDLAQDYQTLKANRNFMLSLQDKTPAEIRSFVTETRGDGGTFTREQSDRLKMAEQFMNKAAAEISKDPVNWVSSRGLMSVEPIDFASEDAPASIRARMVQAETIADEYDLEKPVYFSVDERKDLARIAAQGGEGMMAMAQSIISGDPARGMAMLGEISDDAPALANAAAISLSGGDPSVIEDMAAGIELRQLDGFTSRLPKRSSIAHVERGAGQALALLPKHMIAARETAQAMYEAQAQSGGVFPDAGEATSIEKGADYQLYEQSLNRALGAQFVGGVQYGGLADVGKSKLLAPNWARADKFDDLMDSLGAEDFAATGQMPVDGQGRELGKKDLKNLHYVSVGSGRYRVSFTDPLGVDPQYLADARTGKAYVMDINKLQGKFSFDKRARYTIGGR